MLVKGNVLSGRLHNRSINQLSALGNRHTPLFDKLGEFVQCLHIRNFVHNDGYVGIRAGARTKALRSQKI